MGKRTIRLRKRPATTLLEVIIATMVVAVVMVAALNTVGGVMQARQSMIVDRTGPMLADQLLTEILAEDYEDPVNHAGQRGTESDEGDTTRADFDDVDDYLSWAASPPQDKSGVAMTDYAGWTRHVMVWWAMPETGAISFSEGGLKRVQVNVTDPQGNLTTRYGFRSIKGALDETRESDITVVNKVDIKLYVGTESAASQTTNLVNHAENPN